MFLLFELKEKPPHRLSVQSDSQLVSSGAGWCEEMKGLFSFLEDAEWFGKPLSIETNFCKWVGSRCNAAVLFFFLVQSAFRQAALHHCGIVFLALRSLILECKAGKKPRTSFPTGTKKVCQW